MTFVRRVRPCTRLFAVALALLGAGCEEHHDGRAVRGGLNSLAPGSDADPSPAGSAGSAGSAGGADSDTMDRRGALIGSETGAGGVQVRRVASAAPASAEDVPACALTADTAAAEVSAQDALFATLGDAGNAESLVIGDAVALAGDTLAVAATRASESMPHGFVYVLVRGEQSWSLQAELAPPEGEPDVWFGKSLALAGDTLVVGAPEEFFGTTMPGRVHVFVREAGAWHHEATLGSERPAPRDGFGAAVAISHDTLAVTAYDELNGRVELFERGAAGWQRSQTIDEFAVPEAVEQSTFVNTIALDGGTLAVAVVPAIDDPGQRVFVFERREGEWQPTHQLAGDLPGELFGIALALEDATLVVGDAYLGTNASATTGNPAIGGAYVFKRDCEGVWTQRARLQPDPLSPCTDFGRAVAVDGERILVACPADATHASGIDGTPGERSFEDDYTGAVHVFGPTAIGYEQLNFLKPTTPQMREKYFGWALAADAGRIAVTARGEDAAYVFR